MTLFLTKILTKILDFTTKNSSLTPFPVSSYFVSHPTTLLLKILGGRIHGPSHRPHILGGPSPSPPKSPPMLMEILTPDLTLAVQHLTTRPARIPNLVT